ncbi:hypothetical protein ACEQPO_06050 [Bacillus sp. SL00103]
MKKRDTGHLNCSHQLCWMFGEMLIHVCRKKRISYEGLTLTPETLRAGAVNKITRIHLHILKTFIASDEQIEKSHYTCIEALCAMVQSVKNVKSPSHTRKPKCI